MDRIQQQYILKDLNKKMVLLVGPRQAGKTYLAKCIGEHFQNQTYLNYDSQQDREIMRKQTWLNDTELLILDELHKMPDWKNYLKGVYDTKAATMKILVTGSARLEVYREIGDSLAGRYFLHHLLPFSLAELHQLKQNFTLEQLINRGGFPEPLLCSADTDAERWRMQYTESLVRTDILDFKSINNLRAIQHVFELLRHRVGSPISYQSIAQDISVSPTTIRKYIEIFEALYIIFRITPFSNNIARSLLKEPKIYFFDTGLVIGDEGIKLENLTAVSLLKECYAQHDYQAKEYRLHYLRTKDGKEVDFAKCCDGKIELLIEVKASDESLDKNLYYFTHKYSLKGIQIVKNIRHQKTVNNIDIISAKNFLDSLEL